MRIGICGDLIPTDPGMVDDHVAARIAELGFDAVTAHFGPRPAALDPASCRRARETLVAHGVTIEQMWTFGANLVVADEQARRAQVAHVAAAMRIAAELGARAVIGGAGSASPAGGYAPHPANRGSEVRARLLRSLREITARAQEHGVPLVLECHVLGPLWAPAVIREVLEEVGSPWIRVNLDPANLVGDLGALYESGALIDELFDALGPYAVSGHAKDVAVGDDFVLHLREAVPGDGELDLARFVARFARELPDAVLFVEHLPAELVPRAKAALDRMVPVDAPG